MDKRFLLIILLTLFFTLSRSWEPFIFFTDELQLEETSYQMAKTHDFLIPRFGSSPFFIKSPLYGWLTAPLYWFFPPSPIVRRFWTLVFGIGLVLLTYAFSKRFYDDKTAFWAALFLIGNGLYISFTKAANLDIPNAFFTLLILYFYNLGKKKPRYLYLSAITLGISFLNRSFLALIPLPIIVLDLWLVSKEWNMISPLLHALYFMLLVALPWHLLAYQQYPREFSEQFLGFTLRDHILQTPPGDSTNAWWFYLQLFSYFPLGLLALAEILRLMQTKKRHTMDIQLVSWLIGLLLGLSLFPTRHEWYILPFLPPAAILAAKTFGRILSFISARRYFAFRFVCLLFVSSLTLAPFYSFLVVKDFDAEAVTALKIMMTYSRPEDTLYVYQYPLLFNTTLYHPRTIKTLSSEKPQYLLVNSREYEDVSNQFGEGKTLFLGEKVRLLYYSR